MNNLTKIKIASLFSLFAVYFSNAQVTAGAGWSVTNLTANNSLNFPYEILNGPDGFLWVTERVGKKIVRVNKTSGAITTMIDLSAQVFQDAGQDGLMGMAVHPALYTNVATTTNNYVYIAYTYDSSGRKLRISRLTYNNATNTLGSELTLLQGIPASNDHNSGRLIIGPDTKLYYSCGDQGNNQFSNACNPIRSQILPTSTTDYQNYHGKMLRINLDGSIPTDNPTFAGVKSHVYTYGHRNAQGLVFANDGSLFSSEHGARVDDEINKIEAGKNYGWPQIAGYYDNKSYSYCNWSSAMPCNSGAFSDHNCAAGVTPVTEFESYPTAPPVNFGSPVGTYGSTVDVDPPGGFLTWPTVAPSGIDIYERNKIPNWGRSLLIPTLKKGTLYRAKLQPDGNSIIGDVYEAFHTSNDRYRDIAVDPNGTTFYIVTDNTGSTSGPSGTAPVTIANPGKIIKITYTGTQVNTPPIANCMPATLQLDAFDKLTLLPSHINNGSSDPDGTIASMSVYKTQFDCSHIGTPQTVYLTVVDNQGGETTCQTTLTVLQTTQPLTAPTLPAINANCGVTLTPPSISHKCNTIVPTTSNPITYSAAGTYTVTWSYTFGASTVTANQTVTVSNPATPTGITTTDITTSSAKLNWTNINGASVEVRFRQNGSPAWTNYVTVETNTVTLTDLLPNTQYNFQVRAVCLNFETNWSAATNFTTSALAYCAVQGSFNTATAPGTNGADNNQFITNVRMYKTSVPGTNLINQTSTGSRYTSYTTPNPAVEIGIQQTVVISKNDTDDWRNFGCRIWIDLNRDGDFNDAGESIAGTTNGDNLFNDTSPASARTFNFTIPQTATPGNTRMRITIHQWWTPGDTCGTFTWNGTDSRPLEYEDYAINLTAICSNVSTTWNGTSWSNGFPTINETAIFSGNFSSTRSMEACAVQVTGTAQVRFNSNHTLFVTNAVNVASGASLILENKSSLLQTTTVANTGNIIVKRESTPFRRLDYTAWSAPVTGQNLLAFSPNTLPNRFYTYSFSGTSTATAYTAVANPSTTSFAAARGYMIRAANNWPTTPTTFNGQWTGVPNNGNYIQAIGLTFNLVGNPYPSPINGLSFLTTNSNVSTLYFWTHHVPQQGGTYVAQSNFASFNSSGGTAATAGGVIPNGNIQIGQAFFVRATSAGNVTFNNTQRDRATVSNQFFRTSTTEELQKNRIWLNLTSAEKSFNQILLAYIDGTSNGYDTGFDGEIFDETESFIYSPLSNEKLVIQAKPTPFSDEDVYPIGIKINETGTYTISLEQFDGVFEQQAIYLKDNYTGSVHDLKQNPYSFSATNGVTANRFEIVYKPEVLSLDNFFNAYIENGKIYLNSNSKLVDVAIYDILGRKLFEQIDSNQNQVVIDENLNTEIIIIKAKTANGEVYSKKLIFSEK